MVKKLSLLQGLNIVILGGDRRETELFRCWSNAGLTVKLVGFERYPGLEQKAIAAQEDLQEAEVMIVPLSGIKKGGMAGALFAEEPLCVMPYIIQPARRYLLLAGSVHPELQGALPEKAEIVLTEEDTELALLNAIPTAEGAIQKAMELSEITLHGSSALVLGLGRCGATLARALQGIGALVTAVVRSHAAAALAATMHLNVVFFEEMPRAVKSADFIFNTVPAPVLTADVLKETNPDCLVIDLAAAPGGTDFTAAQQSGLTALLLPGLPGAVAPRSAGRILDRVYRRIIMEKLTVCKTLREEKEDC